MQPLQRRWTETDDGLTDQPTEYTENIISKILFNKINTMYLIKPQVNLNSWSVHGVQATYFNHWAIMILNQYMHEKTILQKH